MRFSILWFLFSILVPGCILGQQNEPAYQQAKATADSIIIHFIGPDYFEQYVSIDLRNSEFQARIGASWEERVPFTHVPDFQPKFYRLYYDFAHPDLKDEGFKIKFYLDSTFAVMRGYRVRGLIDRREIDELKLITRQEALRVAKGYDIKPPIDDFVVTADWVYEEGN